MTAAKEAEEIKELEKAAKIYERIIKLEPHEEQPYHRLMIIYRKLTWYEDELKTIRQKGKKTEALYYPEPIPKWMKRQKVVEKKLGIA